MIELIKFELKKHYIKRSFILVLILFMLLNIFKINTVFNEKGLFSENKFLEYKDVYKECYEEFGGEITKDKIIKLMQIYNEIQAKIADRTLSTGYDKYSYTYNAYSDEIFFRWLFIDEMEYDYSYKKYAKTISQNAYNNLQLYRKLNNKYKIRESNIIANLFWDREITCFTYTEKYLYYLQYDFSTVFVLLICIYAISRVFVFEKESGMDLLLITTNKGRQTIKAKIIATFLFVIMVTSIFGILDYIMFSVFFGSFGSNSSPLYSLANYQNTRLNVNLLQYSVISFSVKLLGILVICTFFVLFSCIFSKALYSYLASFISVIVLIRLYDIKTNMIFSSFAKYINPVSLIMNRELYKETIFINIFCYPIYQDLVAIVVGICWIILSVILINLFARKNNLGKRTRRSKNATS